MKDNLLPLGSVVTLGKSPTAIMIDGYGMKNANDEKMYDYSGAVFPMGLNTEDIRIFNREEIRDVLFIGYQSNYSQKYLKVVDKFIKNIKSGMSYDEAAKIMAKDLGGMV